MNRLSLLVVCLATVYASIEQDTWINDNTNAAFSEVDSLMIDFLNKNHYSGATIGISKRNRLVYTQGYGTVINSRIKMQPTTQLPISSLSKTITATAVLKLYADNQLNLTNRVFGPSGILSSLMPHDSVIADKRILGITVQHLLEHTSGYGQKTPLVFDPMMNPVYLARGHNITNIAVEMGINGDLMPKDIIRFMLSKELESTPGMRFHYSNFGYSILGRVVEEISGMSYEEYVLEEILTPLGMIHTRIGPQPGGHVANSLQPQLNFDEGELDIFTEAVFTEDLYKLWDSTLGWFSTVYDMSRFVNGLMNNVLFNDTVLATLRSHPKSLITRKKERWHGSGVYTDNSHSFWQVGDQHDDEILLHHIGCKNKFKEQSMQTFCRDKDNLNVVIILSSNNRKNIKQLSTDLLAEVINWPEYDLSVDDLGTKIKANDGMVFVSSMIRESDVTAVTNSFQRLLYYPYWMDSYVVNGITYFTIIFKLDQKNKYRVVYSKTKQELNSLVEENDKEEYYLSFIVSCNSQQDSDRIRHSAVFSSQKRDSKYTSSTWWNQRWTKYITGTLKYYKKYNYFPVIQSVTVHKDSKHVTYRFEKQKSKNWKSLTNLTRDNLEDAIRVNARHNRRLSYLDSYIENDELLFSAIFTSDSNQWMVHTELTDTELTNNLIKMSKMNYNPELIVGYQIYDRPMFVVAWKK